MKPTISVVIPVYNRSKVISKTLDSLVSQTYQCFEVIIVDDCSKDSSELLVVLENYRKLLNVKYFRHEINRHGSAARNTGICNASGKYIALLDSDDLWINSKLQKCVELNIKLKTILYSKILDRGVVYPDKEMNKSESVDEYLIINNGSMQTSSLFMHTSFCRQILFDESLTRFQDYDFVIRAQKEHNANFKLINEVLVEMTDDDIGSRISNSLDHQPGLRWLEKQLLSDKSESVFVFNRLVNYAASSNKKIEGIKLIFKYNCLSYFNLLDRKVFVKLLFPLFIIKLIQKSLK